MDRKCCGRLVNRSAFTIAWLQWIFKLIMGSHCQGGDPCLVAKILIAGLLIGLTGSGFDGKRKKGVLPTQPVSQNNRFYCEIVVALLHYKICQRGSDIAVERNATTVIEFPSLGRSGFRAHHLSFTFHMIFKALFAWSTEWNSFCCLQHVNFLPRMLFSSPLKYFSFQEKKR